MLLEDSLLALELGFSAFDSVCGWAGAPPDFMRSLSTETAALALNEALANQAADVARSAALFGDVMLGEVGPYWGALGDVSSERALWHPRWSSGDAEFDVGETEAILYLSSPASTKLPLEAREAAVVRLSWTGAFPVTSYHAVYLPGFGYAVLHERACDWSSPECYVGPSIPGIVNAAWSRDVGRDREDALRVLHQRRKILRRSQAVLVLDSIETAIVEPRERALSQLVVAAQVAKLSGAWKDHGSESRFGVMRAAGRVLEMHLT